MKALVFYITAILSAMLLCSEVSMVWLVLLAIDLVLLSWCHNNITLHEFIKYSGYKTWYKFLKG